MNKKTICKENLDKKMYVNDIPTEITIREYIRMLEEELDMASEPIDRYGNEDLVEYVEELQSLHLEHCLKEE